MNELKCIHMDGVIVRALSEARDGKFKGLVIQWGNDNILKAGDTAIFIASEFKPIENGKDPENPTG